MQSNKITEAVYSLDLQQKRVIALAIKNVNKQGRAYVEASEYSLIFNITLKKSKEILSGQKVSILRPNVTLNLGGSNFRSFNLVAEYSHTGKNGYYQVQFTAAALPYISNLKKEFTKYNLDQVGRITNVYHMRLYESLCQWSGSTQWVTSPDWLREHYSLPASYAKYSLFKIKFLDRAMREINDKTNLMVKFKETYTGRKCTGLTFLFYDKLLTESDQ